MKNKHFHYSISGYRWAPESFRASKRIASQPPQTIPLSFEERYEVGMLALTKGPETAIGCVKHIERARERQRRQIITYGFRAKESTRQLVYCPQLYCPSDAAIGERLRLFKEIRNFLRKNGGRVVVSTECDLDGEYRPVNVRENAITADFSRPMRISMGEKRLDMKPFSVSYHIQENYRKLNVSRKADCSATRFLRKADRIFEKNPARS